MATPLGDAAGLLGPSNVFTGQERIATLARQMPDKALHSLSRYLDENWLLTACFRTRQDGATGIDNETFADFQIGLLDRLTSLRERTAARTGRPQFAGPTF